MFNEELGTNCDKFSALLPTISYNYFHNVTLSERYKNFIKKDFINEISRIMSEYNYPFSKEIFEKKYDENVILSYFLSKNPQDYDKMFNILYKNLIKPYN